MYDDLNERYKEKIKKDEKSETVLFLKKGDVLRAVRILCESQNLKPTEVFRKLQNTKNPCDEIPENESSFNVRLGR